MTYQDELIKDLIWKIECAAIAQYENPNILNSQLLAKARHDLIAFIKEARKNAQ